MKSTTTAVAPGAAPASASPTNPLNWGPEELLRHRPTSPVLWYEDSGQVFSLPLTKLISNTEFHVSTAFIRMTICYRNSSAKTVDALFALPARGTVNAVSVKIGSSRLLETAYIPTEEAIKLTGKKPKEPEEERVTSQIAKQDPQEQYIPDLFRLGITRIEPDQDVQIEIELLEPLIFFKQKFQFIQRLQFAAGTTAMIEPSKLIQISCIINKVLPEIQLSSSSHTIEIVRNTENRVEFHALPMAADLVDFELTYWMNNDTILPVVIHQASRGESDDTRDAFALFVSPPAKVAESLPKDVVILIDRSGSMTGQPYLEAIRALNVALQNFNPSDRFTLLAFDHEIQYFSGEEFVGCTPTNFERAMVWAQANGPRGGTDIATPLGWALDLFKKARGTDTSGPLTRLPIVLLITDGCVTEDKAIVIEAKKKLGVARILTFGIGTFCNWFFLRMLSKISRGFSESVVYTEQIYEKMMLLLSYANLPILTDVTISIDDISDVEIYPFPIPDLYAGAPLTVAGKFKGKFPAFSFVQGVLPGGEAFESKVETTFTELIPVDRVFLKQQMDLLTAQYWLEDKLEQKSEIVELSCAQNIPSPYTSMVAYETTVEKKKALEDEKKDEDEKKSSKKKKSSKMSKTKVAVLATGAVVAVGVGIFAFGDVAATGANIGIDSIFGGDLGDCECCGGGDCDCDNIDCDI